MNFKFVFFFFLIETTIAPEMKCPETECYLLNKITLNSTDNYLLSHHSLNFLFYFIYFSVSAITQCYIINYNIHPNIC